LRRLCFALLDKPAVAPGGFDRAAAGKERTHHAPRDAASSRGAWWVRYEL